MGFKLELLSDKTKPAKTCKLDFPLGSPPFRSPYILISGSCNLDCGRCWIKPKDQANNKRNKLNEIDNIYEEILYGSPITLTILRKTHRRQADAVSLLPWVDGLDQTRKTKDD